MATYITTGPDGNIRYEIEPGAPVEMLKNLQPGSAGPGGQPVPVTSADQMTDESTIYLYMGDEEGYTSGHWYYYDVTDEEWKDGGAYMGDTSGLEADIEALETSVSTLDEGKADTDGMYPDLYAGNLTTDEGPVNKTPYILRASGGGVTVGELEKDLIIGGSVVWNQLVNTSTTSVTITSGHKYISCISDTWACEASDGTAVTVDGSADDMFFDITQMFGTTIADYIYTLEQSTTGAGVSFFRALFPKSYYQYDAGTLRSVKGLTSHKMRDSEDNVIATYPLDSTLTLRGISKLDANNKLCYDGDEYAPDGTVTRNYIALDLDVLIWSYNASNQRWNSAVIPALYDYGDNNRRYNFISDKWLAKNAQTGDEGVAFTSGKQIYCYTADSENHPTGTMIIKATPTTESADPYTTPQKVDPDGTEEYVITTTDDVVIPVGHSTKYLIDLKKKLEDLPSAAQIDAISTKTVTVSGTTPAITAEENTRYICGEVTSLSFTPCVSGLCDVRFTSGSTVTVLTVPNTVKFPAWFDASALEINTTYELNIMDGIYGVIAKWA